MTCTVQKGPSAQYVCLCSRTSEQFCTVFIYTVQSFIFTLTVQASQAGAGANLDRLSEELFRQLASGASLPVAAPQPAGRQGDIDV